MEGRATAGEPGVQSEKFESKPFRQDVGETVILYREGLDDESEDDGVIEQATAKPNATSATEDDMAISATESDVGICATEDDRDAGGEEDISTSNAEVSEEREQDIKDQKLKQAMLHGRHISMLSAPLSKEELARSSERFRSGPNEQLYSRNRNKVTLKAGGVFESAGGGGEGGGDGGNMGGGGDSGGGNTGGGDSRDPGSDENNGLTKYIIILMTFLTMTYYFFSRGDDEKDDDM